MSDTDRPPTVRVGITIGDPGGIGSEVILKGLSSLRDPGVEPVVYGDRALLEMEQDRLVRRGTFEGDVVAELEVVETSPDITWEERPVGPTGAPGATVQMRAFQRAMADAEAGEIDAIATAPWNKSLLEAIDEPVTGHTERLADFFGADDTVMMLAGSRLRVVLVTTHIPIGKVAGRITREAVEQTIRVTARELEKWFGIDDALLAVCGLNPHAGEGGHMGSEELEVIEPTLSKLRCDDAFSANVEGPFPSDTLFARIDRGADFDAVVCMYHDQGLIPLKLLHFGAAANITLGLPVVRTSVDHGTAYDIAGRGVADAGSMRYAVETAAKMVRVERGGTFGEG